MKLIFLIILVYVYERFVLCNYLITTDYLTFDVRLYQNGSPSLLLSAYDNTQIPMLYLSETQIQCDLSTSLTNYPSQALLLNFYASFQFIVIQNGNPYFVTYDDNFQMWTTIEVGSYVVTATSAQVVPSPSYQSLIVYCFEDFTQFTFSDNTNSYFIQAVSYVDNFQANTKTATISLSTATNTVLTLKTTTAIWYEDCSNFGEFCDICSATACLYCLPDSDIYWSNLSLSCNSKLNDINYSLNSLSNDIPLVLYYLMVNQTNNSQVTEETIVAETQLVEAVLILNTIILFCVLCALIYYFRVSLGDFMFKLRHCFSKQSQRELRKKKRQAKKLQILSYLQDDDDEELHKDLHQKNELTATFGGTSFTQQQQQPEQEEQKTNIDETRVNTEQNLTQKETFSEQQQQQQQEYLQELNEKKAKLEAKIAKFNQAAKDHLNKLHLQNQVPLGKTIGPAKTNILSVDENSKVVMIGQ